MNLLEEIPILLNDKKVQSYKVIYFLNPSSKSNSQIYLISGIRIIVLLMHRSVKSSKKFNLGRIQNIYFSLLNYLNSDDNRTIIQNIS